MVERNTFRLWMKRGVFAALCMAVILWQLLPLDTLPVAITGPDVIVALACAWVLRRPEFAPALFIALFVLLADFLFQRPPGLWAALVLVATEVLKTRADGLRDMGFLPEWLTVAVAICAIWLSYRITLAVMFIDQAPLGLSVIQLIATILAYPVIVALTATVFGVRKLRAGSADSLRVRT